MLLISIFFSRSSAVISGVLMSSAIILSAIGILETPLFAAAQETDSSTLSDTPPENIASSVSVDSPFTMKNELDPLPDRWDRILTDEILALQTDIDTIKNASEFGDFQVVYDTTAAVASGPNWGNISAELLYRKDLNAINGFTLSLQRLNTISNGSTAATTQELKDTLVQESNELEVTYENVLNALAVPIFDPPKIMTNLILPGVIVGVVIAFFPRIRKKLKIRY
jgi:hypothetical protein